MPRSRSRSRERYDKDTNWILNFFEKISFFENISILPKMTEEIDDPGKFFHYKYNWPGLSGPIQSGEPIILGPIVNSDF